MRSRQPNSGSPDIRAPKVKVTEGERSSSKKHSKTRNLTEGEK